MNFTELPFKFTAPNRYVFKGAELSFYDDDDDGDEEEEEENDEEEGAGNEDDNEQSDQNDSENESEIETNTSSSNLNATSDESVSQMPTLETSADTLSTSLMSDNKNCADEHYDNDDGTLYLKNKLDIVNLPPEHGIAKSIASPIHSECAYPSREKKEKRESIENYSPNSF